MLLETIFSDSWLHWALMLTVTTFVSARFVITDSEYRVLLHSTSAARPATSFACIS